MATENGDISNDQKTTNENILINVSKAECCQNGKDGDAADSCQKQNGGNSELKGLLGVPRCGHRKSFMEEESAKERSRLSLLKQCSAILKQGDQKYTKESLHRTFQDEVCILLKLFLSEVQFFDECI